ncbi:FecR family protein [Aliarcobacter cryaerophilus]|uniref:FecR family protein n=1 Tax=Aliarcobacter cryaerophilus TaxID=28198 RepID=UPI0021B541FB|nr:FecR family protein [Aliarcobacter cryaerophilus]MCT7492687.1 FecR family protein [Aliarcobacter cryaerophilus]
MEKIIFMFLLFVSTLFANIGTITLLEGEAFVKRGQETLRLNISDSISNNDFIETKTNSKVKITFTDNTIITIGKESSLKIEDYFFDSNNKNSAKTELNVSKGAFHAITGQIGKVNPEKFKLKTKNATIGIRGTEIYGDQNRVFCTSGAIFVSSFGEIRDIDSGNYVFTYENQAPSSVMPMDTNEFNEVDVQLNTNSVSQNEAPSFNTNQSSTLALDNNLSEFSDTTLANSDSANSWGYWDTTASIQDEKNQEEIIQKILDDNNSAITTDPNYVQSLINSATQIELSFSGEINVAGVTPTVNMFRADLYFGGQISTLNIGYEYVAPNINFNDTLSGTLTANGFSATGSNGSQILNGKYYGPGIESIGGDIIMRKTGSNDLQGTFNATR